MSEGISYYIPPEFRRMGKSAMDILSAIDPAQGIMRGMAATGRAFDTDRPADERKSAAIEAALETLAPVGIIGIGAAAKQPAKAVLMDMLTPTGATKDIAEDTLADPSRRKFLQGAAAAVPVAAVAPDVITDVMTKATKAGAKAAINPLDMALKNLKVLRGQMDDQYQILDELETMGVGSERNSDLANEANKSIQTAEMEMVDVAREAIEDADPSTFASASDEAIEEIIGMQYESIYSNQAIVPEHPNYEIIAQEIKRRGMDTAKDKNGVDLFPNARVFAEDIFDPTSLSDVIIPKRGVDDDLLNSAGVYSDYGNLNMGRETPPDVAAEILAQKIRNLQNDMVLREKEMRVDGKSTSEIDDMKAEKRREIFELQGLPPDMDDFYAKGGAVEGVGSLSRVARDMFRGPRGIATLSRFADGGAVISPASEEEITEMRIKVIEDYGFDPVDVAIEEGIDPELLLRVMWTENKGRQGPRSEKGAIGLMQLMPGTAEELGVDPNDPLDNTRGGARYLKKMLEQFESIPLALAAYNAGPGNVQDYGGIPPFKETQNYVAQIAPSLTGEDVDRLIKDSDENLLMSMPVAAEGEYSPRPQLRPFNLPTFIGEPATSPRPMLRPEPEEATPMPLEALPGVIQGQQTNLYEKYGGGIASLANP